MKFCKNLQRVVDISDPEWAPYWTNYKMLKKLIKELPSLVPAEESGKAATEGDSAREDLTVARKDSVDSSCCLGDDCSSLPQEQQHGETAETKDSAEETTSHVDGLSESKKLELGKSPGEIAFFKLLHAEFKKTTHFFEKAQQEFLIREERVREGVEIMKRPNSIMVNEKWSTQAKSIYRLYKDLSLLETFAIMSYCSFSKILKKHDKVTGHQTRVAFMSNVVNKSNLVSYPQVSDMITRCEQMYEDVSKQLLREGKEGLYEDERLFISMINRLNEQALEIEDGPQDTGRRPKQAKMSKIPIAKPLSNQPESRVISTLRSLVEENEARASSQVTDSCSAGGTADNADRKRSSRESPLPSLPDAKRTKQE